MLDRIVELLGKESDSLCSTNVAPFRVRACTCPARIFWNACTAAATAARA